MTKGKVKRISKSDRLAKSSEDVLLSIKKKQLEKKLKISFLTGDSSRQKVAEVLSFNVSIQGCTYPFMFTREQLNEAYGRAMDSVMCDVTKDKTMIL